MSLRSLGKLFNRKRNGSSEGQDSEIPVPIEGYEQGINLLLNYLGHNAAEVSLTLQNAAEGENESAARLRRRRRRRPSAAVFGTASLRRLGRCGGLAGADPFEDLEIDQIVDVFNDFRIKLVTLERAEQAERRLQAFSEAEGSAYLSKLDAVVAANRGHLALSKLTWADFLLAGMWEHVVGALRVRADAFPALSGMVRAVRALPPRQPPAALHHNNGQCS